MPKDTRYDVVSAIVRYEAGHMEEIEEVVELFQHLIDTGTIHHLQGHYGRCARDLIDRGLLTNENA